MEIFLSIISTLVIFLGLINLFRMAIFLIGSDIYSLKAHLKRKRKLDYLPTINVVIPAYNEEKSILSAIISVLNNNYPQEKLQIIIVNDGSTDNTENIVHNFLTENAVQNVTVISQPNMGKAHALNNGIKNSWASEFVMCLDADSYLEKNALQKAAMYFKNSKVMAVATNVKIARSKGILSLIQSFEYLVSYQMKKAQTVLNIEYIIGGIGSTFRRSVLEKINYYDTNTVTEDIDITMKILRHGNKVINVVYGSDVIAYTQGALSLPDLISQRYRWKWGRYQTFLKNTQMFFSLDKKYTKALSWFYLPFALFCDLAFLFEPFILLYIIFLLIGYKDVFTLLSAMGVMSFYMSMHILREDTIGEKEKILFIFSAPLMYFFLYILSFVEYVALVKSLAKIHNLQKSLIHNTSTWIPIKRLGFSFSHNNIEKENPVKVSDSQEVLLQI